MALEPEVCTEDIPLPTVVAPNVELYRKKGIRIYMVLFVVQSVVGVGCITCSVVAIMYDASQIGIPYYVGGFMIAFLMLFSSLLAFRVYNKGPAFSVDDGAKKDVTCALNCHHTCSFLLLFGTVVGLALLWMYGLCFADKGTNCSYGDSHKTENRTIAGINSVLGIVALVTSGVGVCLIRKYGNAFGLQTPTRTRQMGGVGNNLHRTSRLQNVFSTSSRSDINNLNINTEGYTNLGYDPPSPLPPYTTIGQDGHVVCDIAPSEPPPPYCEVSLTDVTLEVNTHF